MEKREEKIDEEEEGNAQAMHSGEGGKEDVVSDEEGRERQGGEEEDKREEREDTRSGDRDKEGQGKKGKEGQEERERGTGEVCLLCQSNRLIETFHIQPLPIIPSSSSSFSPCPSSFLSSSSFWEKFYFSSSSSSPSGSSRRPCLLGPYVDKELGGALHSLKANALIEKMTEEEEEEEEEEEKREKESQDRITSQTGDRIEKREDQEEEGEEKREQKKIKRKRRSKRISVHVADQFCLNFVEKNFTYAMMDISTMVDCIKQQERLSRIPNSSSSSLSSSPSLSSSATSSCSSLPSSSSSSAASSSLPSSSPSSSPACPSSSSSTCHGRKTYYYYRSLGKRPAKDCASLEALGSGVCTAFSLPPDLQLARANEIFRTSFSPKKEREEEKEQQQEEENDSTASEERKEETHQKKKKTEKEKKEELKRQKEKEKEKEKQDEVLCFHSSVLRVAQRGIELWTHYDIPDNFLVQIAGRKRIFLFPPSCVNDLYIRGSSSPIEGLVSGLSEKTLENFPRVTQGLKKAFYCDVTPGYILFLPSLWIHAVFMLPPLHELCQTCRATIQSRISSSSSSFSSFFSSPLHSSSSPSSSGSLCSSSSASCESRDSSIQAGEKKKQNHLLDGGEEEEACCVSVNVFFLDRSLPSHEKIYAKKDIYGNKDGSAYTEALNDVQRTILPRLSNLPSPWSSFYLRKLSLELESMAEALEKREEGGG